MSIHKIYIPMNRVSKLSGYAFQTPVIRLGLIKASTMIPASKQNHMIRGVKSLYFIEIIPKTRRLTAGSVGADKEHLIKMLKP